MCVPFLPGKGGEGGQWPPLCLTICTYTRQQNLQKEGQQLNSQYHHLVLYYVSVCYSFFKVRIDLLCTSCMVWFGSGSLFPDPEMIIMLSQPSLLPVSMFALCTQPVLCTRVKTGASVSVTRKKRLALFIHSVKCKRKKGFWFACFSHRKLVSEKGNRIFRTHSTFFIFSQKPLAFLAPGKTFWGRVKRLLIFHAVYLLLILWGGRGEETENAGEAVIAELDRKNLQQYDTKFHWERERRKPHPPIFLFRRRQQHLTNLPPPLFLFPSFFRDFLCLPPATPVSFPFSPPKMSSGGLWMEKDCSYCLLRL